MRSRGPAIAGIVLDDSVLMGLAIAAQLFAGVVLVAHILWIALRRDAHQITRVAPAWIVAAHGCGPRWR